MQTSDRFTFLGSEFLTFLWFQAEANGDGFVTLGSDPCRVEFDQSLTMVSGGNVIESATLKSDSPSHTEEARTALRQGKKVAKARIVLEHGERQYQFTIAAEGLVLSGVKLPTILGGKSDAAAADGMAAVQERMLLLDELEGLIDSMYVGFCALRSSGVHWDVACQKVRAWVQAGEA